MTTRDNPYGREFPERPAPGFGPTGSTGGPGYPYGQGTAPYGAGAAPTGPQRLPDQMQQKAGQLTEQAKEQTRSFLDSQRERVAEGLGSMASALRQTGQQLGEQDRGVVAQYADRAADTMQRASTYLRDTNTDEMLSAVERYARREPALFLGGALALGFIGARFLKSSRRRETQPAGRFAGAGYRAEPYRSDFTSGRSWPGEAS